MAIFHVVIQKHVVFSNSEVIWAENWTNGDIPCGSSETYGFPDWELFSAEIWTNGHIPCGSSETCGFTKL